MKTFMKFLIAVILVFQSAAAAAESIYPESLENGMFIIVDGGMGVGYYADLNSVAIKTYSPPFYQISINIMPVIYSEEYYREHGNYLGSPYTIGETFTLDFKYEWDSRTLFYLRGDTWQIWDLNRSYSHAEGNPMIPNAAEIAFCKVCDMRFFDNAKYSGGYPVISENIYEILGI